MPPLADPPAIAAIVCWNRVGEVLLGRSHDALGRRGVGQVLVHVHADGSYACSAGCIERRVTGCACDREEHVYVLLGE